MRVFPIYCFLVVTLLKVEASTTIKWSMEAENVAVNNTDVALDMQSMLEKILKVNFAAVTEKLTKAEERIAELESSQQNLISSNSNTIGKLTKAEERIAELESKAKEGKWSPGSYCILRAGGSCPDGFTPKSGHLRSIKLYDETPFYLKPVYFGDSYLNLHFKGHHDANFVLNACCK